MNLTNFLLGLLIALIMGTAAFGFLKARNPDGPEKQEQEKLRAEIAAIEASLKRLRQGHHTSSPASLTQPAPSSALQPQPEQLKPSAETEARIQKLEAQLAEALADQQAPDTQDQPTNSAAEGTPDDFDPSLLPPDDPSEDSSFTENAEEVGGELEEADPAEDNSPKAKRRAKRIANALVMATLLQYNQDYGFLILTPSAGQNLPPGTILGVRRKTGILCRVEVQSEEDGQIIANVLPGSFVGDQVPPLQPGDELIFPPM